MHRDSHIHTHTSEGVDREMCVCVCVCVDVEEKGRSAAGESLSALCNEKEEGGKKWDKNINKLNCRVCV